MASREDPNAFIDHEVQKLTEIIKDLGQVGASGKYEVTFAKLFDATENIFEALAGTLKVSKNSAC